MRPSMRIAILSLIGCTFVSPELANAKVAEQAKLATMLCFQTRQSHSKGLVAQSHAESATWADSLQQSGRIRVKLRFVEISVGLEPGNFWLGCNQEPNSQLRLRVNARDIAEKVPSLAATRTGPVSFVTDVVVLNTLLLALQASGRLLGVEHAHPLPWESNTPMISLGGIDRNTFDVAWKDSNFGSPYFNMVGHPLAFFSLSSYFRQVRGYGQNASFIGGMLMNFLWEAMWENIERPLSLHDLVMNTLGAICGAYDGFGLAFGFDILRFMNHAAYYTEFQAETSATSHAFVRFYPVKDFAQEPLVPWIVGLGLAEEREDLSLQVSVNVIPGSDPDAWDPTIGFSVQVAAAF